jgi:hypothetical protein
VRVRGAVQVRGAVRVLGTVRVLGAARFFLLKLWRESVSILPKEKRLRISENARGEHASGPFEVRTHAELSAYSITSRSTPNCHLRTGRRVSYLPWHSHRTANTQASRLSSHIATEGRLESYLHTFNRVTNIKCVRCVVSFSQDKMNRLNATFSVKLSVL